MIVTKRKPRSRKTAAKNGRKPSRNGEVPKPKRIVFHPACLIFPRLSDAELNDLAADIKTNDLLNPIVLYKGRIADGRNRLLATRIAKVEPRFVEWDASQNISITEWIISQNLF